jgi:hypothetical protein
VIRPARPTLAEVPLADLTFLRWKTCRSECSVKMAGDRAPITGQLCAPTDSQQGVRIFKQGRLLANPAA